MEDSNNNLKSGGETETLLQLTGQNETQVSSTAPRDFERSNSDPLKKGQVNQQDLEYNHLKSNDQLEIAKELRPSILNLNESDVYNPFLHRNVKNPTNNIEALIHLLKGSLGSGILAMPLAFQCGGLWFSLFGTIIVGFAVTYCTHVFVKCGHILCKRNRVPSVNFREIGELSFLEGPHCLKKYSKFAGWLVDASVVTESLGCCCAFVILASRNLQQVIEYYSGEQWDLRLYMAALLPPLICLNFVKDLKRLAPISMMANILFISGIIVSYYYIFTDLPPTSKRPAFSSWSDLPTFFGITIFAVEGIGIVIPIENNMKSPQNFLGCPGVLNIGLLSVTVLYAITGFFGYLKYGSETKANIAVNLPTEKLLGQVLKLTIATGVFFSYSLSFYIAMSIIYGRQTSKTTNLSSLSFHAKRSAIVAATVLIAALFPNLGPILTLLGALCLGMVGLVLPPVFETLIYSKSPGFGKWNWRLWKNIVIFLFGITGLVSGTTISIKEIINSFDTVKD